MLKHICYMLLQIGPTLQRKRKILRNFHSDIILMQSRSIALADICVAFAKLLYILYLPLNEDVDTRLLIEADLLLF